jgi:hypothetical protein
MVLMMSESMCQCNLSLEGMLSDLFQTICMKQVGAIRGTVKQEKLAQTYYSANTRVKALAQINFSAL